MKENEAWVTFRSGWNGEEIEDIVYRPSNPQALFLRFENENYVSVEEIRDRWKYPLRMSRQSAFPFLTQHGHMVGFLLMHCDPPPLPSPPSPFQSIPPPSPSPSPKKQKKTKKKTQVRGRHFIVLKGLKNLS